MKNNFKHGVSALILATFLAFAFGSSDDKNNNIESKDHDTVNTDNMNKANDDYDAEREIIENKLKTKAKNDWPDDYMTQEYWVNEQLEAYDYMLQIEDNELKRKAQRDWPLDFMTQKFWYNKQVEAKERMN